ncbi:MAG: response regulator [Planctomycetota bacterium]|jgi:DNA-binding response OmpR family regulator
MADAQVDIDSSKKQIYIIDEARAVRTFVKKALEDLTDYQVVEFESGHKGFSFLTGSSDVPPPQLLVFESKFRDIEAISMLKGLRGNTATKNIPVIIFTNNADKKNMILFLQSGADEYLKKPSNAQAFSAKVQSLLKNQAEMTKLKTGEADKAVLVVDDNPDNLEETRALLSKAGHCVISCGNALNALRIWQLKVGIAMLDIDLPDIDGINLAEAVKNRFSNAKIILTANDVKDEDVVRAKGSGIAEIMKKPIQERKLLEKIEKLMQPSPPIGSVEIEKQYKARLLSGMRPLPPVLEGNISLTFDTIEKLFEKHDEIDEKQVLMSDAAVWVVEDRFTETTEGREPAIQEGRVIKKVNLETVQKYRAMKNGTALNSFDKITDSVPLIKTYDLGVFLYEKEPIDKGRIIDKLKESPFAEQVMENMDESLKEQALDVLENAFGYLDLYFYYFELENLDNEALLHWLSTSFLSAVMGHCLLNNAKAEVEEGDRKAITSLLAICGFMHDIGQMNDDFCSTRGSYNFFMRYPAHSDKGYEMLEKARIFECLKFVIRDHHKDLNEWSSKYDSCTKVVQVANDIDNFARKNGVFQFGSKVKPCPEHLSWGEACLMLLDQARNGVYEWEIVKELYRGINRMDFAKTVD